jgi:peptide/nickel transport system ATP-binding protein
MLFISHDMTVVEYLCDRVAVMYLGQVVEIAPAGELFTRPQHPYTRSLIASVPRLDAAETRAQPAPRGEPLRAAAEIAGCPYASRCPAALPCCTQESPPVKETAPEHLVRCFLA